MQLEHENTLDVEMSENEIKNEQESGQISELESVFKDIDDLNDPSCMDQILIYLQEIKDEDCIFMEVNMQIFIYHKSQRPLISYTI